MKEVHERASRRKGMLPGAPGKAAPPGRILDTMGPRTGSGPFTFGSRRPFGGAAVAGQAVERRERT